MGVELLPKVWATADAQPSVAWTRSSLDTGPSGLACPFSSAVLCQGCCELVLSATQRPQTVFDDFCAEVEPLVQPKFSLQLGHCQPNRCQLHRQLLAALVIAIRHYCFSWPKPPSEWSPECLQRWLPEALSHCSHNLSSPLSCSPDDCRARSIASNRSLATGAPIRRAESACVRCTKPKPKRPASATYLADATCRMLTRSWLSALDSAWCTSRPGSGKCGGRVWALSVLGIRALCC